MDMQTEGPVWFVIDSSDRSFVERRAEGSTGLLTDYCHGVIVWFRCCIFFSFFCVQLEIPLIISCQINLEHSFYRKNYY